MSSTVVRIIGRSTFDSLTSSPYWENHAFSITIVLLLITLLGLRMLLYVAYELVPSSSFQLVPTVQTPPPSETWWWNKKNAVIILISVLILMGQGWFSQPFQSEPQSTPRSTKLLPPTKPTSKSRLMATLSGKTRGVAPSPPPSPPPDKPIAHLPDLLTGHKILHHTLHKEAQLQHLQLLRNATFRKPQQQLQQLFTTLHQTSRQRLGELESLWKDHTPVISPLLDAPTSLIGQAIQDAAEQRGMVELLLKGEWSVRFYLLQAQATRMVAAIASSTAAIEPSRARQQWLTALSTEYEGLREQLVHTLQQELERT